MHARGETVADDLDPAAKVGQLDQLLSGGDMDGVDLDPVGPVCYPHLKGPRVNRSRQVRARCLLAHEQVGCASGDVGEHPVEPPDAVADEDAIAGQVAKGDGYCLPGVAKLDTRGAEGN